VTSEYVKNIADGLSQLRMVIRLDCVSANQVQMPETRNSTDTRAMEFELHRSRLFGLAYRMLGLRAEAEDIVQETYLRWHGADHDSLRSPVAWLVTVATRLSIDRFRALEADRVSYVGEWLPEPIVDTRPDRALETQDDISIALLYVLQRLGAEERAAFLLHEVLDTEYSEIARILDKSESAVRQIVHRARERVRSDRPRFEVDEGQHRALVGRFLEALLSSDESALMALFAENATWTADGGGKAAAALNVLRGNRTLTKFLLGIRSKAQAGFTVDFASINGSMGLLVRVTGKPFAIYSFETDGERIRNVYAVVNPDKLQGIS
jgi:RNA polymerase sigma-70 factor (ECF subfamily)